MSYPMIDFTADPERLAHSAEEWLSAPVEALGAARSKANHELTSALHRGRDLYVVAQKRVGKQVREVDEIVRHHPYPVALIAIGAGALVGYLLARRFWDCR
jgi:ElaB/YqjD/DUF883 family membrane-anchored ribosome-binding protein